MRKCISLGLALLIASPILLRLGATPSSSGPGFPAPRVQDWLLVPGKRAGPITRMTSEQDLRKLFAERDIERASLYWAEEEYDGTRVYPKEPGKQIEVFWESDTKRDVIRAIRVCGTEPSRWHSAEGITLGVSLGLLERLNGRPFKVRGFWQDGGGFVSSWEGGKLANWEISPVRLGSWTRTRTVDDPRSKDVDLGEYLSTDAKLRALELRVTEMWIEFESE